MTSWLEINSFALMRNVRTVRDKIEDGVGLFAVVKANAYGHGLEIATEAFWRAGVDGFVVSEPNDALFLVEKGYRVPILLLHPPQANELWRLLEHKIRLAGTSPSTVADIAAAAVRHERRAYVHLELETGMHRSGVTIQEAREIISEAQSPKSPLVIEGLFTHLCAADNPDASRSQIEQVANFLFELQQRDMHIPCTHILASESVEAYPDALFEAVRVGRALYGAVAEIQTDLALTWKTRLCRIERIKRGDTVGYGKSYTAERDMFVGTIPVGYSDGLDRSLGNTGFVLVRGKRCPIIGRVCMNDTMIDLSSVLYPELGDEVVLLGRQMADRITPQEMAEWANTIDYEILARLSSSLSRIKVK